MRRAKVIDDGKVILPLDMREAARSENGDTVIFGQQNDEMHIRSSRTAIERLQAMVQVAVAPNVLLSEELITDRRRAANRS
ncbi:MAG: hypothetical protein ACRCY3_06905 [Sphingorhabdus sp.]